MMVNTYNQKGEKIGQTTLPAEIFDVKINADLLHQVVVSQMANRRQGTAHTKDRGEVRGGGRKPWRQKGTGRARHGSIRSPLWKGGGVVFGPRKEKVYKKRIPRKMKRAALFMALSEKARNNALLVLDSLTLSEPKTKTIASVLRNLSLSGKSVLLVCADYNENLLLSVRNLPRVHLIEARNLNALDVLNHSFVVFFKDSIKTVEKCFYEL